MVPRLCPPPTILRWHWFFCGQRCNTSSLTLLLSMSRLTMCLPAQDVVVKNEQAEREAGRATAKGAKAKVPFLASVPPVGTAAPGVCSGATRYGAKRT
jgi:hypothetical protein